MIYRTCLYCGCTGLRHASFAKFKRLIPLICITCNRKQYMLKEVWEEEILKQNKTDNKKLSDF